MNVWRVTESDRDEQGKIKIGRSLADLLPIGATSEQPSPPRRWEQTTAVFFCGLLVGVALFALLGRNSPAPAAPRPALAPPTTAPTITTQPSATPAPTATLEPTATAVPTAAQIFAPPPAPTVCTIDNAPYQERRQVAPIGSVVGISCQSADEARANADALAAAMIATAEAARP